jgi:hypothetical protein
MKIIYNITLLIFLYILSNSASAQNFSWAKQLGGNGNDLARCVVVDASGNVYTTGRFEGTADFDPGSGFYSLTSYGFGDIFISKLDASGNFVWANQIGGIDYDMGNTIAIDDYGNIYIAGSFGNTVDFDPGSGIYNLTAQGGVDIFISKLDNSGNFIWAKRIGASGTDAVRSIAIDNNGNSYATGIFSGTVDFDPGSGTSNLIATFSEVFILKLDEIGNFSWVKQLGSAGNMSEANSIAIDLSNNVYTTGIFYGTADFDPGIGTFYLTTTGNGPADAFVSKLDSSGMFVWAKQLGGPNYEGSNGLALDNDANVYLTGFFFGTADFDPGPLVYNLMDNGNADVYITKLDSSGAFIWAKQMGGTAYAEGAGIAIGVNNSVQTTGVFSGTADFNPGSGIHNLTSDGSNDIFISKLDSSGNFLSAFQIGASGFDVGFSIATDSLATYISGQFQNIVDFDPGLGIFDMIAAGSGSECFVMKLSDSPTSLNDYNNPNDLINIYPNPSNGEINISSLTSIDKVTITNTLGQIIYGTASKETNLSIQITEAGIYFIQIKLPDISITKKIIVIN